ncbi:MAG: glutamate-5-semialdehyde dehydrogenase [Epsilonproteobacteria bacterium]|nr:glutamate-5-semialdehyde dehydrogenase [Campylobacterota bacterium]
MTNINEAVNASKSASRKISLAGSSVKNRFLENLERLLDKNREKIIHENNIDIENNRKRLSSAKIDRLTINNERISEIIESVNMIRKIEDPVGKISSGKKLPNGLLLLKKQVPIGLILIIYESRPNVTIDAAGLCLKAGNGVILKGGKESINTNRILYNLLKEALRIAEIDENAVYFVDTTDRKATASLLEMDDLIDLVIPRGGGSLIKYVSENSKIPVIKHDKGLCHIYVDNQASLSMARKIVYNAKVEKPGVCNAVETLLVNSDIAENFLPETARELISADVTLLGCEKTAQIIDVEPADENDWRTEYLDLTLSIKIVDSVDEAINHINQYGSHHSDAIVTDNFSNAMKFADEIDSAAVYVNASTRFTDGGQFGMGAEIGISTNRLHARGPMGIEELTIYKYIIIGNGQIRD